jgi:hypothetical protein
MPDNGNRRQLVRVFDLAEIFAMPINALIDADSYAAEVFANFVREYGFEKNARQEPTVDGAEPSSEWSDRFGKLRMITFTYRRPLRDGTLRTFRVEIPWLSLIPLPTLTIESADLTWVLNVLGATEQDANGLEPIIPPIGAQRRPQPSLLTGRAKRRRLRYAVAMTPSSPGARASETPEDSTETRDIATVATHIECDIKIRRSDLPAGLADLLNVMSQAVENSEQTAILGLDSDLTTFNRVGEEAVLIATLRAADDRPLPDREIELRAEPNGYLVLPDDAVTNSDGKYLGSIIVRRLPRDEPVRVLITAEAQVPGPTGPETVVGALRVELRKKGRKRRS